MRFTFPGLARSRDTAVLSPDPASVTLLAVSPELQYLPPTKCFVTFPGGAPLLTITECEPVPDTTQAFPARMKGGHQQIVLELLGAHPSVDDGLVRRTRGHAA